MVLLTVQQDMVLLTVTGRYGTVQQVDMVLLTVQQVDMVLLTVQQVDMVLLTVQQVDMY